MLVLKKQFYVLPGQDLAGVMKVNDGEFGCSFVNELNLNEVW